MHKGYLIALVLFCGFLGAVAQIFFKFAAKDLRLSFSVLLNWRLLLGMGLYLVAMVLFLYALRFGEVSRLYPLIASSYIWIAILAAILLRERVTPLTIAGILCIVLGIGILMWKTPQ